MMTIKSWADMMSDSDASSEILSDTMSIDATPRAMTTDSMDANYIKIWVGGIPPLASEEDLALFFATNYGRVSNVKVIRPKTNPPYAFVEFLTDGFKEVIYSDAIVMDGHTLRVGAPSFHQKNSLWIGGCPNDVTDDEVSIFFKQVDVDSIRICRRDGHRPFALVTLWDKDDLEQFVGMPCAIRGEPLSIRLYDKHPKVSERGSNPSVQDYIDSKKIEPVTPVESVPMQTYTVQVHNLPANTRYYHRQFKMHVDYYTSGCIRYEVLNSGTHPPTCEASVICDSKANADQLVYHLNGSRMSGDGLYLFAYIK